MKSASEWSAEHFNLNEQTVRAIQADAAADMRERCAKVAKLQGRDSLAATLTALPLEES
jgi:hypothetical protein